MALYFSHYLLSLLVYLPLPLDYISFAPFLVSLFPFLYPDLSTLTGSIVINGNEMAQGSSLASIAHTSPSRSSPFTLSLSWSLFPTTSSLPALILRARKEHRTRDVYSWIIKITPALIDMSSGSPIHSFNSFDSSIHMFSKPFAYCLSSHSMTCSLSPSSHTAQLIHQHRFVLFELPTPVEPIPSFLITHFHYLRTSQ